MRINTNRITRPINTLSPSYLQIIEPNLKLTDDMLKTIIITSRFRIYIYHSSRSLLEPSTSPVFCRCIQNGSPKQCFWHANLKFTKIRYRGEQRERGRWMLLSPPSRIYSYSVVARPSIPYSAPQLTCSICCWSPRGRLTLYRRAEEGAGWGAP